MVKYGIVALVYVRISAQALRNISLPPPPMYVPWPPQMSFRSVEERQERNEAKRNNLCHQAWKLSDGSAITTRTSECMHTHRAADLVECIPCVALHRGAEKKLS